MAVKKKIAQHAVKHADIFLPLLGLLLVVVLLLIVTPSKCGCHRGSTSTAPSSTTSYALSPASGPVDTVVTIHGSGFGAHNTIEMNNLVGASMKDVASADGKTLTFAIPQTLGPNCKPDEMCAQFLLQVTPNAYNVSVITDGSTQNVETFTVTAP